MQLNLFLENIFLYIILWFVGIPIFRFLSINFLKNEKNYFYKNNEMVFKGFILKIYSCLLHSQINIFYSNTLIVNFLGVFPGNLCIIQLYKPIFNEIRSSEFCNSYERLKKIVSPF